MAGEDAPLVPEGDDSLADEPGWGIESAVDDEFEDAGQVVSASLWERVLGWIISNRTLDIKRLEMLSDAVMQNPKSAVNYVFRGEEYLRAGETELAALDFETALELAQKQFEQDDWGLVSQALRDQAERGLELAQRASKSKRK
jgi:hypothetical protein